MRRTPKRWPASNTDRIVRHVARQFPEIPRRHIAAVLNAGFMAIRDSLADQVRQGERSPRVRLHNVGSFEVRLYKAVRRHDVLRGPRVVPPRWKLVFRPSQRWADVLASLPTRTIVQEDAGEESSSQEHPACPVLDEETPFDLPNLPSGSPP
jgi:nucleoid DNA-binding protein